MSEASSVERQQRQALEKFLVLNRDLAELELLAKRFNIFEALGVVWAERKHSNFLGFLLNPAGNHGLGDRFLKSFLQASLANQPSVATLTPIDIDLLDLSQAEVSIERGGVDILIRDARGGISVIVENKIYSKQHSDQLARYFRLESERYSKRTVFGIYLTIDGDDPENENYAPISHSQIRRLLTEVSATPGLHIEREVQFALGQYLDMLGRHFMADEQIKRLCERIYKEHKQAIDLILSHMPDPRAVVREKLKELIGSNSALILDDCTKSLVRFIPRSLDLPFFKCGSGWTSSKRVFLLEFVIDESVFFFVEMGPGDPEKRKHIVDFALAKRGTFQGGKEVKGGWQSLFKKEIVERLDDSLDPEQLAQMIESKWQDFLERDLPPIEQALLACQWPTA